MADQVSDVSLNQSTAYKGLDLDNKVSQVEDGSITWAMNALVSSFDGNMLGYQNETANEKCFDLPGDYQVIGRHIIPEKGTTVFWLYSETIEDNLVYLLKNSTCQFTKLFSAKLGMNILNPVKKSVHRVTSVGTEVYWVDGNNRPRYVDINNLPYETTGEECSKSESPDIDVNKLNLQPDFTIPNISISGTDNDGQLSAGTYQFGIQYSNSLGDAYTSVYSITNTVQIFDSTVVTEDFNFNVNKSISMNIFDLDTTGIYDYFNLIVIQTVNNITTPYLVGTFPITGSTRQYTYTGANSNSTALNITDVLEKYPVYQSASDITKAQDILVLGSVTNRKRIAYQSIANQIKLKWQTIPLTIGDYKKPEIANKYTGYSRDEVYAFEFVPLLKDGTQADGFHIPSRVATSTDTEVQNVGYDNNYMPQPQPNWKIRNTASVLSSNPLNALSNAHGEFAYYESTDTYPCDEWWGDLQGQPIRHHKFPDNNISPFFNGDTMYVLGLEINPDDVLDAIINSDLTQEQKDEIVGFKIVRADRANNASITGKGIFTNVLKYDRSGRTLFYPNYLFNDVSHIGDNDPYLSDSTDEDEAKVRYTFHSPDTSFYQPYLGTYVKMDGVLTGTSKKHLTSVTNHPAYSLSGKKNKRVNPAMSLNALGTYDTLHPLDTTQNNNQRILDIVQYVVPGIQNVNDTYTLNNWQRESSVYMKLNYKLPFTKEINSAYEDTSKALDFDICSSDDTYVDNTISTYYGALKSNIANQYGQMYSYQTVDTGYFYNFDTGSYNSTDDNIIFGGDTYINMFAYKSKLPFFVDNKVGQADNIDTEYSALSNVGKPKYYLDAQGFDTDTGEYPDVTGALVKDFLCTSSWWNGFQENKPGFILFAYGINYFPVESNINVDLRQAYNGLEGDFFPHVGNDIPDDWLQESNVKIANDNTYYYNKTFSKVNSEFTGTHIPTGYDFDSQGDYYPFRAVFSEAQNNVSNQLTRNNWRIFRPASIYNFPQTYGQLVSLDGIENRQVYARFENATLLYNSLLTMPSSTEQVYLGQSLFSDNTPPINYSGDSESGYCGSQHKMLLKTEYGHISIDSRRGNIFLFTSQGAQDITKGVSQFLTKYLDFSILKSFPDIDIDNNFNGIGLTATYDSFNSRIIITKLDYEAKVSNITYSEGKFYSNSVEVSLDNRTLFNNKSLTISYSFLTNSWISFHSYLPLYYITDNNNFFSGINGSCWKHNSIINKYNNFYGKVNPFIVEYPQRYQMNDELLQSIKDYTIVQQFDEFEEDYVQIDDVYYNKMIIYNKQDNSGVLELEKRPQGRLDLSRKYPIYNSDSKTVTYEKKDNLYKVNTFWSVVRNSRNKIWIESDNLQTYKELNSSNINYSKLSYHKGAIQAKDLKIRLILDNRDDVRLTTNYLLTQTAKSWI